MARIVRAMMPSNKAINPDKNPLDHLRPSGIIANKFSPFIAAVSCKEKIMNWKLYLTISTILLAGCATTYQPMGLSGGYEETKLEEGKYSLYFLGNGFTSYEEVKTYWHKRAKELCPSGYDHKFGNTNYKQGNTAAVVGTTVVPISVSYPQIEGLVTCK